MNEWFASRRRSAREAVASRGDAGNLVAVIILVFVLAALIVVTVGATVPTFHVATSAQNGEQAVAQANSGLSDALFQLDQMGDQVSSFCVGQPPASLLASAGLTSCVNETAAHPVPAAPGVQYYVAEDKTGLLPFGVTNEVELISQAKVGSESRRASELVYRESNNFGIFAIGALTINGNSGSAAVGAGSGNPLQITANVTINFGGGPSGQLTCTGGGPSDSVWIAESGATISCSGVTQLKENTVLSPVDPSICAGDQVSTAFAPCIATGGSSDGQCPNCQVAGGSTYCPLPGLGFKAQPTLSSAPTPPQDAVFDCTSLVPGGPVFIGDTSGTSITNGGCASTSTPAVSLPDHFSTIPPGNYYLDSNDVVICPMPPFIPQISGTGTPSSPIGPVNLFVLPEACGSGLTSGQCPFDTPGSGTYTCPVGGSTSPQLTVNGYINATNPPNGYTGPTVTASGGTQVVAGAPSDFNILWGGDSAINFPKDTVMDSNLYAPGASLKLDGTHYTTIGSLALNCFYMKGGPTLDFTYGEHGGQILQNWTVSQYQITP
jgi:hypothetical protein